MADPASPRIPDAAFLHRLAHAGSGGSAAVAYMLLFVSTVAAVSFFNFVIIPQRRARA
jgi:hypothetical protein